MPPVEYCYTISTSLRVYQFGIYDSLNHGSVCFLRPENYFLTLGKWSEKKVAFIYVVWTRIEHIQATLQDPQIVEIHHQRQKKEKSGAASRG